jgi:D-threo-aldose 1-dehydrogenase
MTGADETVEADGTAGADPGSAGESAFDLASRRPLGSTGLSVGPLGFGTAPLGSMPDVFGFQVPDDRALATVRAVLDSPIAFIDTAAIYGDGEAERRIGAVFAERGGVPAGVLVCTKADRDATTLAFDGAQMRISVEGSRRRLGMSHLPLVLVHDPEYTHATFEETMGPGGAVRALLELRDAGVIGHIGIGAGPVEMLRRYIDTGVVEVLLTHNRYTLVDRSATRLIEHAVDRGVAVLNGGAYGSGILAKGSAAYARYGYQVAEPALLERVRTIERLCAEAGIPMAAAALQFSMRNARITSTVVGMTSPERVSATLTLVRTPIPDGLWDEVESIGMTADDPRADRW